MDKLKSNPPVKELEDLSSNFHNTSRLKDGTLIGKIGGMRYILTEGDIPVSYGFQKIESTEEGYECIIGALKFKLNKQYRFLSSDMPTMRAVLNMPDSDHFSILYKDKRGVKRLADGKPVEKDGSKMYMLDDKGKKISEGFHSITPITFGYIATRGAHRFILSMDGKIVEDKSKVLDEPEKKSWWRFWE
ncbi:hypothetical protein ACFLQI_03425 [Candidatus Undinarchaeota archaeon]